MIKSRMLALGCVAMLGLLSVACAGRPSLIPNSDKNLRKTAAQFAADAAARHPYKADAPRAGEAPGRATVGYMLNQLDIVNLSPDDWQDVEVWVNEKYVVYLPRMERKKLKTIPFQMMYDERGNYFPLDNSKTLVKKVEVLVGGKMYDIPVRLGD